MSKKERSGASAARTSSGVNPIQDVSKEPKTRYAKLIMRSRSNENHDLRFIKEYHDAIRDRQAVEVETLGRKRRPLRIVWSFDLKGERMQKAAIERHVREQLYPRVGRDSHVRFPREKSTLRLPQEHQRRRFPRYSRKWEIKLGLRKEK